MRLSIQALQGVVDRNDVRVTEAGEDTGLYLFVVTAGDNSGNEIGTARGKFVLIR